MKKNILLLSAILFVSVSFSQVRVGPKLGINIANLEKDSYELSDSRLSLSLGGILDYSFSDKLFFQSGLLLSGKGDKEIYKDEDYKSTRILKFTYIELPANLGYKFDLGDGKLFLTAGFYGGIALSGEYFERWSDEDDSGDGSEKINFGNGKNDDDIKRGDFGLNFGGGIEINSFLINFNYGLGLVNMDYDVDNEGYYIKNRVFNISIGYLFDMGNEK